MSVCYRPPPPLQKTKEVRGGGGGGGGGGGRGLAARLVPNGHTCMALSSLGNRLATCLLPLNIELPLDCIDSSSAFV